MRDDHPIVFVSYSRKDQGFAEYLEAAVDPTELTWWRDIWEIAPGDYFRGNVSDGIRACAVLLLLVSNRSVLSREVLSEVELAHEVGKRIVPGYIEPLDQPLPSRLIFLTGMSRIDFYTNFDDSVGQLLAVVRGVGVDKDRAEADLLPYSTFRGMAPAELAAIVLRLQQRIAAGRHDARLLAKTGEYLLHLGRSEEAVPRLVDATKLDPSSAMAPYLLAVAVMRHRRPRVLTMREVEQIMRLLRRAEQAEPGLGHVAALEAVVTTDYFDGNGLLAPESSSSDLWRRARARGVQRHERQRIVELVDLDDRSRAQLEQL